MTPSQITALGTAAIRRCEDLHGGRDGLEVIQQAGKAALASLRDARGGRSDSEIILLAGKQALDRQRQADGGRSPIQKIFAAHQHGQDISGETMAKALGADQRDPFSSTAADLGALLASMQAEPAPPSPAEMGDLTGRSAMVQAALQAEETRRHAQEDQLAAMKAQARLRPDRPIAPYAHMDDRLGELDVTAFGDTLRRDMRRGHRFQGPRDVEEHAHRHWNLPRATAAELFYRLQSRVLAQRAERGAPA